MLIMPITLISTAFSSLATPAIASSYAIGGLTALKKRVNIFTFALTSVSVVYEWVLFFWGRVIVRTMFGERYEWSATQAWIWGLVPIILALFWGKIIALQVTMRPQSLTYVAIFWGGTSFLASIIFIPMMGLLGASISILSGYVAALCCASFLFVKWMH
jgi:O-antigen/teichoic acid export membrane protein